MTKQQKAAQALKRVNALEKAITGALKKHGAKLQQSAYMQDIGTKDACVCAIGAAILANAPNKDMAELYELKLEKVRDSDKDLHEWAAEVVNDGITANDLTQLECGFEGWAVSERDDDTAADPTSPYWDLGVNLARKTLKGEELKDFNRDIIDAKTRAFKMQLLKEAKLEDFDD